MTLQNPASKGLGQATKFAFDKNGELRPQAQTLLGKALSVQRPVVLAYVRGVRRRNPHASPAEIAEILRKHYVNFAMGGGAAVGATAVVPGLGTGAALGLAAVETGGFLELSALYSQSLAELHGMQVRDPKRANVLVMGLMLGGSGKDLVRQFSDQIDGGPPVHSNFGALVTKQIPTVFMDSIVKKLRKKFIRTYAARTGGSILGRALPFGVGAVVGGTANRVMANTVVKNARNAFGDMPDHFSPDLDPSASSPTKDADITAGMRRLLSLGERRRARKNKGAPADQQELAASEHTEDTDDTGPEAPRTWRPDPRL